MPCYRGLTCGALIIAHAVAFRNPVHIRGLHVRPCARPVVAHVVHARVPEVQAQRLELPEFDEWMQLRKIKAPHVKHAVFHCESGGTQRGVMAERDLAAGETIVEVPRDSALCLLCGEGAPAPDLAAFWAKHPQWYVRLGTKLLLERDKGSASAVSGYLDLLPGIDECAQFPVEWPTADVAQLRYDKAEASITRQREKWQEVVGDFRALCPQRATWSDVDLRWAWHMCLSRAFAGNFGGGMLSLVPLLGLVAEVTAQNKGLDYALIPMVDSCNHDGRLPTTKLEFSPLTRMLTLKASKGGTRQGEEVLITYGDLDNDQLLQRFGFVEAECPHDTFVVSKEFVAEALEVDGGRDQLEGELIDRGLGSTCLDEIVLRRRGEVEKQLEVEMALGMLFGDDSAGVAGLERASKRALYRICEEALARINAPEEGAGVNGTLLAWREAKSNILRQALLATARFV